MLYYCIIYLHFICFIIYNCCNTIFCWWAFEQFSTWVCHLVCIHPPQVICQWCQPFSRRLYNFLRAATGFLVIQMNLFCNRSPISSLPLQETPLHFLSNLFMPTLCLPSTVSMKCLFVVCFHFSWIYNVNLYSYSLYKDGKYDLVTIFIFVGVVTLVWNTRPLQRV